MIIKEPRANKAELIMHFLHEWNPVHAPGGDFFYYKVDAEEIAQSLRKNSSLQKVEDVVREAVVFRMELDGVEEPFDEEGWKQCSQMIYAVLKQAR